MCFIINVLHAASFDAMQTCILVVNDPDDVKQSKDSVIVCILLLMQRCAMYTLA